MPAYQPLNPTQTGTTQQAVDYLNSLRHAMGQGDLSQDELNRYASQVGYQPGQQVTGSQINQIVAGWGQPTRPTGNVLAGGQPDYGPSSTAPRIAPRSTNPFAGLPSPTYAPPDYFSSPEDLQNWLSSHQTPSNYTTMPLPHDAGLPEIGSPVTSDADWRLSDPIHGNDPEVLAWLNRPGGPGNPNVTGAYTGTRPSIASDQAALQSYIQSWAASHPGANPSVANDPGYWAGAIARTHGSGPIDWNYWEGRFMQPEGAPEGGGGRYPPTSPGGNYSPTNPFDDPATKNYIDLLNQRIQDLLKPYENPDAGPLQEWMRKFFAQLQGPTYSPEQEATIRTQALDPIEQQRQAELRNVALTMASRGITPGSGPFLQAERDINQKYDQIRAQIQGGLAVNEINQGRQNQLLATQVGGNLAQFTQGLFGAQQARANQALEFARQIPDLAQSRLAQAMQLLQGSSVNPAQLLASLQGFQNQGLQQNAADSQFWQTLLVNLARQFGLG